MISRTIIQGRYKGKYKDELEIQEDISEIEGLCFWISLYGPYIDTRAIQGKYSIQG